MHAVCPKSLKKKSLCLASNDYITLYKNTSWKKPMNLKDYLMSIFIEPNLGSYPWKSQSTPVSVERKQGSVGGTKQEIRQKLRSKESELPIKLFGREFSGMVGRDCRMHDQMYCRRTRLALKFEVFKHHQPSGFIQSRGHKMSCDYQDFNWWGSTFYKVLETIIYFTKRRHREFWGISVWQIYIQIKFCWFSVQKLSLFLHLHIS